MKSHPFVFSVILIVFFILRLCLTPLTFHVDILSQANWGQYVSQAGPQKLFDYGSWTFSWPNHPPLAELLYGFAHRSYIYLSSVLHHSVLYINQHFPSIQFAGYFQFVDSLDKIVSPEQPFNLGYLLSLKLLPIIGDLLIALLIYKLALNRTRHPLVYPLLYLISPFSWYISSLWGQTDQIACFFTLLSFICLPTHPIAAIVLFYLGISIKPTSLFLVPLFIYLLFRLKIKILPFLVSVFICFGLTFLIFKLFSPDHNIFYFTFHTLIPRLLDRPSRLTTNSFNFWHIFALDQGLPGKTPFLFIPGSIWGFIIYIGINIYSFKLLKKINLSTIFSALFLVGFGSWLFLSNMLDRYSFFGLIAGLIVTFYYPKTLRYWLVLSLVYWLNLFHGWWYPASLSFLKNIMTFNNGILDIIPSLINVIIFLILLKKFSNSQNS